MKTAYVTVHNSGAETDDVIQLYIKDYSENAVPNVSLCGFRRIHLKQGESLEVEIPVYERAFTAVDDTGKRKIFGSRFTLYAGTHQPDKISEKLSGTKCLSCEIEL